MGLNFYEEDFEEDSCYILEHDLVLSYKLIKFYLLLTFLNMQKIVLITFFYIHDEHRTLDLNRSQHI